MNATNNVIFIKIKVICAYNSLFFPVVDNGPPMLNSWFHPWDSCNIHELFEMFFSICFILEFIYIMQLGVFPFSTSEFWTSAVQIQWLLICPATEFL